MNGENSLKIILKINEYFAKSSQFLLIFPGDNVVKESFLKNKQT